MKNNFKFWISFSSTAYFGLVVLLSFSDMWPESLWWIANLYEILPLWVLLFPAGWLIFISIKSQLKRESILNLCSLVIILFFIMEFNLPLSLQPKANSSEVIHLRVMTVNIGEVKDLQKLFELIDSIKPDIIAFEEVVAEMQPAIKNFLAFKKWDVEFDNQTGIASQLKIINSEYKNRRMLGGWGTIVGKYSLESSKGIIHFLTVHLETPRKGVEALMDQKFDGIAEMKHITQNQEEESLVSLELIKNLSPAIIAGDFNMLATNPIFKKYWGAYKDAFGQKGIGFGYTKHTRWHGARIDHILADSNWAIREVEVGSDIGGDHHPVIADLEFTGRFDVIKDFNALKQDKISVQNPEDIFISEDFENSLGRFIGAENNELVLVKNFGDRAGRALKTTSLSSAKEFSLGFNIESWPIEKYSTVKFFYNIASGTPIGLAAETSLGDWICLGGVAGYQCLTAKSPHQYTLLDDGAWHEVSINVKEAVQALVPSVNNLKAFQFFIPSNRREGDNILLDDFMITK